jgi:nicotinamidase-related amidase
VRHPEGEPTLGAGGPRIHHFVNLLQPLHVIVDGCAVASAGFLPERLCPNEIVEELGLLFSVKWVRLLGEVEFVMEQAFGLNIPQTLDDVCDPTRLAVVVYDMQVGIVKQIENGQQITDRVLQVLDAARAARIRVIFTRHMSLPRELMGVSQFRMAMAWQRVKSAHEVKPRFLRDSPGFHLIPELNPRPCEAVFDKIAMSAFEGTPLDIALRDCGIDAFAIVGIAMEIGIEPTARHGADLGYIPVVVKDACGFGHRDAAARSIASLEFSGDSLLTNVETICAQFQRIRSQQMGGKA